MGNKLKRLKLTLAFGLVFLFVLGGHVLGAEWVDLSDDVAGIGEAPFFEVEEVEIESDDSIIYNVTFELPGFYKGQWKHEGEEYTTISIPEMSTQEIVGKPGVPFKLKKVDLPDYFSEDVNVEVDIVEKEKREFENIFVMPSQQPLADSQIERTFSIDQYTYDSNQLFPEQIVKNESIISIRGNKLLFFEFFPMQTRPGNEKLLVYKSIEFKIKIKPDIDISSLKGSLMADVAEEDLSEYMILINSNLFDSFGSHRDIFNEFVEWKKQKGHNVTVVDVNDVYSDNASSYEDYHLELVDYIRDLDGSEYPDFLLIIGDEDLQYGVPGEEIEDDIYSDYKISQKSDNELIPELYVGRLPASDIYELEAMLEKVLVMEKNPPDDSIYERGLFTSHIQMCTDENTVSRLFSETVDASAVYFEENNYLATRIVSNQYADDLSEVTTWLTEPYEGEDYVMNPLLWVGAEEARIGDHENFYNNISIDTEGLVSDAINEGVSIIQYRGHGSPEGLGSVDFTTSDIRNNNLKFGALLLSITCHSGAYFSEDSFINEWMAKPDEAGYAAVAQVDSSSSWRNDWLSHGVFTGLFSDYRWNINRADSSLEWTGELPDPANDLIFENYYKEGKVEKLGPLFTFARKYQAAFCNRKISTLMGDFEILHLFGDPDSYIMFHEPQEQDVTIYDEYVVIGDSTINIEFDIENDNEWVNERRITLYSEELGIHQSKVSDSGSVSFDVNSEEAGDIYLTMTGYGLRPYRDTINVFKSGDINGDGQVNIHDMILLCDYIVGNVKEDEIIKESADVNGDGEINIHDVIAIANYIVGNNDEI